MKCLLIRGTHAPVEVWRGSIVGESRDTYGAGVQHRHYRAGRHMLQSGQGEVDDTGTRGLACATVAWRVIDREYKGIQAGSAARAQQQVG